METYLVTLGGREFLVDSSIPLSNDQAINQALMSMQHGACGGSSGSTGSGGALPGGMYRLGTANCISSAVQNTQHQISGAVTLGTAPFAYIWTMRRPDGTNDPVTSSWTGQGPYSYTFTQSGSYILSLNVSDSCAAGAKTDSSTCTVAVSPAGSIGSIACTSMPSGSQVWLDGSNTGQITPVTLPNIAAGSHTITFKLSGYQDCARSVTVTAGGTATTSCTLTAGQSSTTAPAATSSTPLIVASLAVVIIAGIIISKKKKESIQ